ncbi:MAG: hypothetical protein JWP63_6220 [Candidatus Solibacter sp.]|nr:hypothetical protein [Candidatus Solibacter sp.]
MRNLRGLQGCFLPAVAVAAAAGMVLIRPQELAPAIAGKTVFHTGPNVLYRSKHIPGSVYAGSASSPAGLALG